MDSFDFNGADPQRAVGDLIPDNTVAIVVAVLRPGGHGPGGWLKNSRDGSSLMADFEFTVEGGEYDRRKFWSNMVVEGSSDGQQQAAAISRSRLRAMLESAYGVNPGDDSPDAVAKRQVAGWGNFDGLRFCAKIGVEKGGLKDKTAGPDSERYADKNVLKAAVTPDEPDYISPGPQNGMAHVGAHLQAGAKAAGGNTAKAVAAGTGAGSKTKPSWA